MGFSRQEYWSGLHFLLQGIFPNPGIEPLSPAFQTDALTSEPPGKPKRYTSIHSLLNLLPISTCWPVRREAMVMAPPPTHDSAVSPGFHGCRLSSTGISHHSPLTHIPSTRLSAVNSSLRPGIAPQSLNSSSQLLRFPGDLLPCPGYVWLQQGLSESHSTGVNENSHRSAVSLPALNVSLLTQTVALMWRSDPCFSSPTHQGHLQSY